MRARYHWWYACWCAAILVPFVLLAGCGGRPQASVKPRIEFTRVPEASLGGPARMDVIEGRVVGARPGQRIVLFAKTDMWWVQPFAERPFTSLDATSAWKARAHLGSEYAALLVEPGFSPPAKTKDLPAPGGAVAAVAQVRGRGYEDFRAAHTPPDVRFSGFDWQVRGQPSDRGGSMHHYDPSNVWVDGLGRLHLKITKGAEGWRCAEVRLKDPLGYGTYSFSTQNLGHLEPAAVLGMYTFDSTVPTQNYREMDIEVSRWGDPSNKSAQFAVQPYYVAANVVRFDVPHGAVTHRLRWSPGRADFRTVERSGRRRIVADYSFTSGVPSPGEESVFIGLYAYGRARSPLTKETEVVVDAFEYVP